MSKFVEEKQLSNLDSYQLFNFSTYCRSRNVILIEFLQIACVHQIMDLANTASYPFW